jgi:cellulose biosynthesis protein BcsQ
MKVVAIYNMKGGVGKTTAAVNLSYLAAAGGARVLLWDLDPQGAASFAFRVRPEVEGFSKKSLESGRALADAIRETDYANLHLLPADFAYRKFDRFLDHLGKPKRVVRGLIETLGADYDLVFLDCPAGFSLITEGIFAAADAILVPTVPALLSLRTLAQIMKWADRSESPAELVAFFSMVDRRKTTHRQACEWSRDYPEIFLPAVVPYASVVEQMPARRMPLAAFAPRDAATAAFAGVWSGFESHVRALRPRESALQDRWKVRRRAVETLMARLESSESQAPPDIGHRATVIDMRDRARRHERRDAGGSESVAGPSITHRFDTEGRDLERGGHAVELIERGGRWALVTSGARVQIDRAWAFDILSGALSPLAALERRIGRPAPPEFEAVRKLVAGRALQRIHSAIGESERSAGSILQRPEITLSSLLIGS